MITLQTDFLGAFDSPDHICSHGCIRDNNSSIGLINEICQYFENKKITIIDLGCAGGQFVADFVERGHIAIGLEGSPHAIDGIGKENWKKYFNKNLFLCDITENYQLYSNNEPVTADVIHSEEVLEHISEDKIDNVLCNIKKHLKPTGICLFGISIVPDIQEKDGKTYILHQSVFPPSWWIEKIENNGFEILKDGRNDNCHYGYIFNNTVRWDGGHSIFVCCKLK